MPRYLRASLWATSGLSLLVFFFCLYATMYVRSAIAGGALENPNTCMTLRDKGKLAAGPDQKLADWWIDHRVRFHHGGGDAPHPWHWHGLITMVGMPLATSPAERIDLAYASMRPLRICGQPIQET